MPTLPTGLTDLVVAKIAPDVQIVAILRGVTPS
jgi:hypothetical protein